MNIYKSKRDNKLYILSINSPPKFTGEWLESMSFDEWPNGEWKKVPQYKKDDFVKISEI